MSYMPTITPFNKQAAIATLSLTLWLVTSTAFGQAQQSSDIRELLPNQTLEREMTVAEIHRYKFDLQANEFFQVRVELKGVDAEIKFTDASGNVLATMYTPEKNEIETTLSVKQETLSFIAVKTGSYTLELGSFGAEVKKGNYTIRRGPSRTATAKDKRRVEVERIFLEGTEAALQEEIQVNSAITKIERALEGWRELADTEMVETTTQLLKIFKAWAVYQEAMTSLEKTKNSEVTLEWNRALSAKFHLAAQMYREIGHKRGEAESLFKEGYMSTSLEDNGTALRSYEQALSLFRDTGDRSQEAETLNNIGNIYSDLGNLQKSLDYLIQALALFRDIGDRGQEAAALVNISWIHRSLDEKQKALDYYNQALALFRDVGDREGEAYTLVGIGTIYSELREMHKALDYLNQAVVLLRVRDSDESMLEARLLTEIKMIKVRDEDKIIQALGCVDVKKLTYSA